VKRFCFWLAGILLFTAAVAKIGYYQGQWTPQPDPGELEANADAIAQQEELRKQRLDAEHMEVFGRSQARARVVSAVIEERITLLEAAAHFRALDASQQSKWIYTYALRTQFQGRSDEERLCRRVIDAARWALIDKPDLAAAVVKRLQAELSEHLARHGRVQLPTVSHKD
jgi:hypothetical protein